MSEKIIVLWTLIGAGLLLTIARRLWNRDPKAGFGTSGWTIVLIVIWLMMYGPNSQ